MTLEYNTKIQRDGNSFIIPFGYVPAKHILYDQSFCDWLLDNIAEINYNCTTEHIILYNVTEEEARDFAFIYKTKTTQDCYDGWFNTYEYRMAPS